jgi:hypothetical protein
MDKKTPEQLSAVSASVQDMYLRDREAIKVAITDDWRSISEIAKRTGIKNPMKIADHLGKILKSGEAETKIRPTVGRSSSRTISVYRLKQARPN